MSKTMKQYYESKPTKWLVNRNLEILEDQIEAETRLQDLNAQIRSLHVGAYSRICDWSRKELIAVPE